VAERRKQVLRKREQEESSGWELTLADMMTLLMTFFVVIVSISVVDAERFQQVSAVLHEGLDKATIVALKEKAEAPPPVAVQTEIRRRVKDDTRTLDEVMEDLEVKLANESAVDLVRRGDAVAVDLKGSVLFALGTAELTPAAVYLLDKAAQALWGAPYDFVVEGHSDNLPIKTEKFPSNWELSAARAASVVRFLIDRGFDPDRLSAVGLADTEPLAPNTDLYGNGIVENQIRNRRVVILVTPRKAEPAAPAAPAQAPLPQPSAS